MAWRKNVLSRAGRRILVQPVLTALPVYTMQTALLPVATCHQIDKIARNFLWGGDEHSSRSHLHNWDVVCSPKANGGLGIRKTREANIALLSKVCWALVSNSQSLACLTLKAKYLRDHNLSEVKLNVNSSSTWKGIFKCREILLHGCKWKIGSGNQINFWSDWWVGEKPIDQELSQPVPNEWQNLFVASCIDHTKSWNLQDVEEWLTPGLVKDIQAIPIPLFSVFEDRRTWIGETNGLFTARSTFTLVQKQRIMNQAQLDLRWVWKLKCTETVRFFVWLLAWNRFNTNVNRVHRRMTHDASCPRCHCCSEFSIHLFWDCGLSKEVWACWEAMGFSDVYFYVDNMHDWLRTNCASHKHWVDDVPWGVQFVFTLWFLWKARNNLVFQQSHVSTSRIWYLARKVAKEVHVALQKQQSAVSIPVYVKWKPPAQGAFLLNTDGAIKSGLGLASTGGLIRDSNGNWLRGFLLHIGHTDSLAAELWGVRAGLAMAKSMGLQRVIVELDAAVVMQFLKSGVPKSHPYAVLVLDALSLISEGWVVEIRHIYREGNRCADFLANLAQIIHPGLKLLSDPPPDLLPLLLSDIQDAPVLRV